MNKNQNSATLRTARIAVLAAACAVLGYIALDLGNIKVTFESLPILLSAFMFGPVEGALTGGIGTFIYQMLRYGVSFTTGLWILPYVLCGLVAGLIVKNNRTDKTRMFIAVIIAEFMVLFINTFVIYIDSKIYGYYSPAYVFGSFAIRTVICAVKSVLFGCVLPVLTKGLSRAVLNYNN